MRIIFPTFTVAIRIGGDGRLVFEVVDGANKGFHEEVDYVLEEPRPGYVLLSWQERIGSTVVHAIDFDAGVTSTFVTRADDGTLVRMAGRLDTTTP